MPPGIYLPNGRKGVQPLSGCTRGSRSHFFAPIVFLFILFTHATFTLWSFVFIIVSGLLELVYFLLLQRGYLVGDLSLVYPMARGTGPLLSTILAILILQEHPTPLALFGSRLRHWWRCLHCLETATFERPALPSGFCSMAFLSVAASPAIPCGIKRLLPLGILLLLFCTMETSACSSRPDPVCHPSLVRGQFSLAYPSPGGQPDRGTWYSLLRACVVRVGLYSCQLYCSWQRDQRAFRHLARHTAPGRRRDKTPPPRCCYHRPGHPCSGPITFNCSHAISLFPTPRRKSPPSRPF